MTQVRYTACWLASVIFLNACTPGNGPQPSPSGLSDSTLLNVAYGPDPKQTMDVYLPENRNTTTKVVVLIHGGAWSGGDKSDMAFIQPMIAEKWPEAAVVNINYRLANGALITHREISSDLKEAMDYISKHHDHWQVSADMALMGASAGGHLALLYAYQLDTDDQVKAVSDIFGPAYFADWEFYNSFNILLGGQVKEVYKTYTGTY